MVNYIDKLKDKCKLNDKFVEILHQIFDKLIEFGYISHRQQRKLEKKLYDNLDTVILGKQNSLDFKSGYYDAVKKELYIKDINNLESIYQRIIYILTTTELDNSKFDVGYSTANLSTSNYKIEHKDFGLNRAVVSNLVCRLLYTVPTTLSIIPSYRTYDNDFLGNKIISDNDIYFLEGRLLSQLCYILNFDEEKLYINLFNKPRRYLNKMLYNSIIHSPDEFLEIFDLTSREYSNYNKLIYLNKLLNDNYINIRKNALNSNEIAKLNKKRDKIYLTIRNALIPLINIEQDNEEFNLNIESYLSEQIDKLEESVIQNIAKLQDIFVDISIDLEEKYSDIDYAIRLKNLQHLLIIQNEKLDNELYETISFKLLYQSENTASNLVEKLKYSMANEILSNQKYIKVYKDLMFNKLENININKSSSLVAVTIDNAFMQLIEIDTLNFATKNLKNNTKTISLKNMSYLLNNITTKIQIDEIENMFSSIKDKFNNFANISIANVYLCQIDSINLAIIIHDDTFSIISIRKEYNEFYFEYVKLSEAYSIFNVNNANLPILYNKKKDSLFKKILASFSN